MQATLQAEVAAFVEEATVFARDWDQQGPMVPGLAPLEAVSRLRTFQQLFEVCGGGCLGGGCV